MPDELTLESLYGSVKAMPERETVDFEDQIAEAMEDEADRIVSGLMRQGVASADDR